MGGHDWVKAQALDKLVPQEQLSVIVSRQELADNSVKLLWVKAQMEHARDASKAQQVSAATAPKWDRDGDVNMGAVLQDASKSIGECSRAISVVAPPRRVRQACSWWRLGRVNAVNGAIIALAKAEAKEKASRKEILRQRERA